MSFVSKSVVCVTFIVVVVVVAVVVTLFLVHIKKKNFSSFASDVYFFTTKMSLAKAAAVSETEKYTFTAHTQNNKISKNEINIRRGSDELWPRVMLLLLLLLLL